MIPLYSSEPLVDVASLDGKVPFQYLNIYSYLHILIKSLKTITCVPFLLLRSSNALIDEEVFLYPKAKNDLLVLISD